MLVLKYTARGKDRIVEVLKVSDSVQFDDRAGWILVKDLDREVRDREMHWIHPTEVFLHWIRDFG